MFASLVIARVAFALFKEFENKFEFSDLIIYTYIYLQGIFSHILNMCGLHTHTYSGEVDINIQSTIGKVAKTHFDKICRVPTAVSSIKCAFLIRGGAYIFEGNM